MPWRRAEHPGVQAPLVWCEPERSRPLPETRGTPVGSPAHRVLRQEGLWIVGPLPPYGGAMSDRSEAAVAPAQVGVPLLRTVLTAMPAPGRYCRNGTTYAGTTWLPNGPVPWRGIGAAGCPAVSRPDAPRSPFPHPIARKDDR